jgi:uncharacterized protein (DUF885 family)
VLAGIDGFLLGASVAPSAAMRLSTLATFSLAFALGCGSAKEAPPAPPVTPAPTSSASAPMSPTADEAFAALSSRFLARYLATFPVRATEAGDHTHDHELHDLSLAGDDAVRRFVKDTQGELAKLGRDGLSPQNRIDAAILANQLDLMVFSLDELREAELNPMLYTGLIGDGIDPLITRSFAPVEVRMASLLGRLRAVPKLLADAKTRLGKPTKVHTETAIAQNKGLVGLMKEDLAEHFAKVPAMKGELEVAAKDAAKALEDFGTFLEKEVLPRSDASFRLGRARFEKKLRLTLEDDVDSDAVAKSARELLTKTQEEMFDTAKELWPTLMKGPLPKADTADAKKDVVRKVLAKVAEERSSDKTIVADAKKWLDEATRFVKDKDLVRLPEEPCQVIEMPEYRRGVAIAYCDSSGPLEKKPETFYAISPTPKDWKKRGSSRSIANTTAPCWRPHHPRGHARALPPAHAQQPLPLRDPRRLRSGPFVEGWAVYTEWLMAKHGFGGPKVRLQRQKMVLRMSANTLLDHGIHAGTMEEKEALDLMMKEAFQEEGEAVGKWKRARLTSAQLTTYFYGFTEMMKLREAAEKKPGFSERAYHDKLLSFGSPAMRHIRALMNEGG